MKWVKILLCQRTEQKDQIIHTQYRSFIRFSNKNKLKSGKAILLKELMVKLVSKEIQTLNKEEDY